MRLQITMEDAVLLGEAVSAYQRQVLETMTGTEDRAFREALKGRFEQLEHLKNELDLGWIKGVAVEVEPMNVIADFSVRAL